MAGAYCLYHVLRGVAPAALVFGGSDPVLRWIVDGEKHIGISAGIGALGGLVAASHQKVRGWMTLAPVVAAILTAGLLAVLDVMQPRLSNFAG